MTDKTLLDMLHFEMDCAPENSNARLRFYEALVGSELFVLLRSETENGTLDPEIFAFDGADYLLLFDREDRLTTFTARPAAYAALSGRTLVAMLAGHKTGLGLNLGVAPSSILIPPEAIDWLTEMLNQRPQEFSAQPASFGAPVGLPETFLLSLDARLASAAGLAERAHLASVIYDNGVESHILGVVDALPGAEQAIADAVSEALVFSGLEASFLDIAFLAADDAITKHLIGCGLRFDIPKPDLEQKAHPFPGGDPKTPPRLR